jgi:hypothetical protein
MQKKRLTVDQIIELWEQENVPEIDIIKFVTAQVSMKTHPFVPSLEREGTKG